MTSFRQLPGLPTYGPLAVGFPANWARLGREGLVVEFATEDGTAWIGNFCPGLGGLDAVRLHPDGTLVLVISSGALWCVDPLARSAEEISPAVLGMWELESGELLLDCQGIALIRLGRTGVAWRTRRISWDGFQSIRVAEESVTGEAWSPIENRWLPFSVDLASGQVEGGSYHEPEMHCGDPPSR
jgi:hypothetical protein